MLGRGTRGGAGDPSPVRRILPERRAAGALRAEGPRSEGRCFGLEPKTTCARWPLARKTARRGIAADAALRAESPRSLEEGALRLSVGSGTKLTLSHCRRTTSRSECFGAQPLRRNGS